MNALLTLTRREIAERRPLLLGTLAAAVLTVLPRLLPGLRPGLGRDWHESLAMIFGITFPIALAIGLGASIVGEDLAQRRLGFYFSRPLSAWVIWASKNLAAILITLGAGLAFMVPVALLSGARQSAVLADLVRKFPEWFLPWVVLLVGLIFVAEAVAGAYRARDGLFALDIVALAILVSVAAALVWRLHAAGMPFFVPVGPLALANFVSPAIRVVAGAAAVAGAMQVILGRTDARRGHLALSTTFWGTLALGLTGAIGFASWVLSVAPQDVGAYPWSVITNASSSHVAFWADRGRGGFGYQPKFLLDTATGAFDRLPQNRVLGFAFSADGRRAVWMEGGDGEVPELVLRRLDVPGQSIRRSSLDRYAGFNPFFSELSDDGRLAVISMQNRIAVVDTDSGREVASATSGQLGLDLGSAVQRSRYAFVGDTAVRGFFLAPSTSPSNSPLPLAVFTFDFRTGQVTAGPKVSGIEDIRSVRKDRALLVARNGPLVVVEGTTVHELVPAASGVFVASAILIEDGVAAVVKRGGDPRLLVWDHEYRSTLDVPSPGGSLLAPGEPRAGWLALSPGLDYSRPARTLFVDSKTGAVARVEEGLTPAGNWFEGRDLPAGSPGSRLFVGPNGDIVRLDLDTGRRETILKSPGPEDSRSR